MQSARQGTSCFTGREKDKREDDGGQHIEEEEKMLYISLLVLLTKYSDEDSGMALPPLEKQVYSHRTNVGQVNMPKQLRQWCQECSPSNTSK